MQQCCCSLFVKSYPFSIIKNNFNLEAPFFRRSRRLLRPPFLFTRHSAVIITSISAALIGENINDENKEQIIIEEEEEEEEEELVQVGYISKVHGLKGELCVIPTTDFPFLRFSTPGKRWLRSCVLGKEVISEVELLSGRDHLAHKTWIITLKGIQDVDQAKQVVGSTLLVKEGDRPELEEGEFYTPDLVGMRVLLQETGTFIGVVANIFNFGASDLLQVKLNSTKKDTSKTDIDASGQMVWVPFVEAIVPKVDMNRREMFITPPKGLLELNLRTDMRSKKERRQMEWKERKKLQNHLITAKKKLSEIRQDHLLGCLKIGEKAHKKILAKQVASINFKLLQHALQSISMPLNRFGLSDFIHSNSAILHKNTFNISSESLSRPTQEKDVLNYKLHNEGCQLLMYSKAAIIVILNNKVNVENDSDIDDMSSNTPDTKLHYLQELVHVYRGHLKVEEGMSFPLILVSPSHEIESYEKILLDGGYYGMDSQKVWLLEEEKLPIISKSVDPKILMKSSCEIIQTPIGSGGVFSLLSSHHITDKLIEMGVEYVQICCLGRRYKPVVVGNPLFLGLIKYREADMAIHMNRTDGKIEEESDEFNIVFSMSHLTKICKLIDKPQFLAIPVQHAHAEMVKVEGKHVEQKIQPIPNEPNSYSFHSSIFSVLTTCSPDSISTMCVTSDK